MFRFCIDGNNTSLVNNKIDISSDELILLLMSYSCRNNDKYIVAY